MSTDFKQLCLYHNVLFFTSGLGKGVVKQGVWSILHVLPVILRDSVSSVIMNNRRMKPAHFDKLEGCLKCVLRYFKDVVKLQIYLGM